jgi:hypothetical protein
MYLSGLLNAARTHPPSCSTAKLGMGASSGIGVTILSDPSASFVRPPNLTRLEM